MKKVLFFLLFFVSVNAHTTLSPGDLIILAVNGDGNDGCSIMPLVNLDAGTVFYLTDYGWSDSEQTFISNNSISDCFLKYTVPSGGISAGTIIRIDINHTTNVTFVSSYSTTKNNAALPYFDNIGTTNTADEVLIFQESIASPVFIFAVALNFNGWEINLTSTSQGGGRSALPGTGNAAVTDLVDDLTALSFGNGSSSINNYAYTGPTTSATAAEWKTRIATFSNWTADDLTPTELTGAYAVLPTSQSSSILLPSNTAGTQLNISWTNGNGFKRAVFMKQGTGSIQNPSNNTTYSASADWNSKGTQLGASGYYCVYNGTGNSVTVTNTVANTEYTIQAFEYNGSSGSETYYTATATGNPNNQTTLPVELTSFTGITMGNSVMLTWQTATEVNNYGFDVERSLANKIQWEKIYFINGSGNCNSSKEYSFTDKPDGGSKYKYRLKQIDIDGKYEYSPEVEVNLEVPLEFSVKQNFPNPFNPTTKIEFSIPSENNVTIKVFNILGKEVATLLNEHRKSGTYSIDFYASNLSSGIYFYRIVSGNNSEIKKMILLR
ncbi:MAG: T9SS type A sorting domain-containing protein [Bacteroidota bacterium]